MPRKTKQAEQHKESTPLKDLIPYGNNPRHITTEAVDDVAESIKRYGFRQPIVIDKENIILAGHVRYLASQKLGLESVWVERAEELSTKDAREYRLADNRTSEYTDFDVDKLAEEMRDLEDVPGWDNDEIDDLRDLLDRKDEQGAEVLVEPDTATRPQSEEVRLVYRVPRQYASILSKEGYELIQEHTATAEEEEQDGN